MFELFRRQHLKKFFSNFGKPGLEGLAVTGAQYQACCTAELD